MGSEPEEIAAIDALARVGLRELAVDWTDEQRARKVRWRGYPTPFDCGNVEARDFDGIGRRTVRAPASYAGCAPIMFAWSSPYRTFLAVVLERLPGTQRPCLMAAWVG